MTYHRSVASRTPTTTPPALRDRFLDLGQELYARLRARPPERWIDPELTLPQIRLLLRLAEGPARMGEIASFLAVGLPSATGIVDRLVARGLVSREDDPDDRRVVRCRLEAPGRTQVQRFWRVERDRLREVAATLSEQELATVVRAMEILVARARRAREGAR
jgi:DNA-binding MarR family transcriptional regulator